MTPRVAILGPFEAAAVRSYLRPSAALDRLPPGMGGSCLVNLVLARLERNLPTDVITLDPNATEPLTRHDGDTLRLWVVKRRTRKALRDGYRQEIAGLLDALAESRPDICHANWTYEYGLAALEQTGAPAVTTVHDHAGKMLRFLGARYLPHYAMARKVLKHSRYLTAVAPHIAAYIKRLTGKTVPVIPNTLSRLVWDQPARRESRPATVISALGWAAFRNPKTALRAFAVLRQKHPEASYVMIGPGFEPGGPAAQWAGRHGLAAGVHFRGRVPYPEALALIAGASILLHPSLEESFGGPVAEAMAFGVPVIAAREAGGPAWLLEGTGGRRVTGRSVDEMAEAMDAALRNRETQEREDTRQRIRQLCDPDRVLAQWSDLYHQILQGAA